MAQVLQFKIKAVNEASSELKAVKRDLSEVDKEVNKTSASMLRMAKTVGNLKIPLTSIAAGLTAIAAASGVTIKAWSEYEKAVKRVDTNLKLIGVSGGNAVKHFENVASSIQAVTTLSDGAALELSALFLAMNAAPEQVEKAVKTAADLAAATGKSVKEVGRQIAKTYGGFAGELGEIIPQLKELTKEQLQAGEAVDVLAAKFGGAATEELKTFAGQFALAKNEIGDVVKQIGRLITESESLANVMHSIRAVGGLLGAIFGVESIGAKQAFLSFLDDVQTGFGAIGDILAKIPGMGDNMFQRAAQDARDLMSVTRGEIKAIASEQKIIADAAKIEFETRKETLQLVKDETWQLRQQHDLHVEIWKQVQKQAADRRSNITSGIGSLSGASISGGVSTAFTAMGGPYGAIAAGITELVINSKDLPKKIAASIQGFVEGLGEGIPKLMNYLSRDFLPQLIQGLSRALGQLIRSLPNIAGNMLLGMVDAAFVQPFKAVTGFFGGLFGGGESEADKIERVFKSLEQAIRELGVTLENSINSIVFGLMSPGNQTAYLSRQIGFGQQTIAARQGQLSYQASQGNSEEAARIMEKLNQDIGKQVEMLKQRYDLERAALQENLSLAQQLRDRYVSLRDTAVGAIQAAMSAVRGALQSPEQNVAALQQAFRNAPTPEAKSQAASALAGGLQQRFAAAQQLASSGAITGEELARIQKDVLRQLSTVETETKTQFDQLIESQNKQINVLEKGLQKLSDRLVDNLEVLVDIRNDLARQSGSSTGGGSIIRDYRENRNNIRGRISG